jgi:predicted phosphodiesterase
MVKKLLNLVIFLLGVSALFTACSNDIIGLAVSSDLDDRLSAKDTFNFLSYEDLNISLPQSYSFLVLSDTHIEDGDAFGLEKMEAIIKDPSNDIHFVVILGDITQYGAEHDILKFIEIAKSFEKPCYPVIGNHDVYFDNWPVWRTNIGSTHYKVNGTGTTFFVLDSANTFYGKKQLDWLENELKEVDKNDHVFVFTHAPLFVTGPADLQQIIDVRERARIISILKDKCDIMFFGHLHKRMEREAGNVKYVRIEDFKHNKTYIIAKVTPEGVTYDFYKMPL